MLPMYFCHRNMLIGQTSDSYSMVVYPGLRELLRALDVTDEVKAAMMRHVTQIYVAHTVVLDYAMRGIKGSDVFEPL